MSVLTKMAYARMGLATVLVLNAGTGQAMPGPSRTVRAPRAKVVQLATSQTNAPAWQNQAKLNGLADWLRQQVAARTPSTVHAQVATTGNSANADALQRLEAAAGSKVALTLRPNGTPLEIKGPRLQRSISPAVAGGLNRGEATARTFLKTNRALLLLDDPDSELSLRQSDREVSGRQHLRFRQEYLGLPVWPCELMVHLDASGDVELLDGAFTPTPRGLSTKPSVTADRAMQQARQQLAKARPAESSQAELIIFGRLDAAPRLAWKFDLTAGLAQAWRCVVDAQDGSILAALSLVNEGAVTGSGVDGLGQTRTLRLWQDGATIYMVDTSKGMYDTTSTPPNPDTTRGAIYIWDSHNTPPTDDPSATTNFLGSPVLGASSSATSGWVPDAVGAAYGLSKTYDYYLSRHGRNSLDGAGGTINGFVRVGINWRNAFWTQGLKIMVFGDTLPSGLDVCAHELTHGVIYSVGDGGILNYHDQPGALNEAFADIFGENVEAASKGTNDWLMGQDTVLGALRNMANPGSLKFGNNPYPSRMSEYYPLGADQDHGGVHENSSIINHCYYLLAAGLDGAIGIPDAERIFYRAMTLHLAKESQFIDARHACISSAEEIFGTNSVQVQKTAQAFDTVEIVDAPTTPNPTPIPVVQGPDSTLFLRWDPFAGLFGGEYELFRRETALGDSATGTFINTLKYLAQERVSVSGDGSFALYVTTDNDYGAVNTDGTSPEVGGEPGLVHSLTMTSDAQRFAFVFLDASGQPTNVLGIIDLAASTSKVVKLYAVDSEGNKADIIKYADVLDFTSDGQRLVYDAYTEARTANGTVFSGWTMYALDLATTNIIPLINLSSDLDFGNPSLGKRRNNLVTFEIVSKETGLSSVYAANLFSGSGGVIGQLGVPQALGKPDYLGDEAAIVFSAPDGTVNSFYSLVRQPLGADGVTTNGALNLWIQDADVVTMYRRGTFVASNALPNVSLTGPADGQGFSPPANVLLKANASDPDGTVTKVEFYRGSTKLGEAVTAPYDFAWSNVPAGKYNLIARAIDNLGGTADSSIVSISVGGAPKLSGVATLNGGVFQFTLSGDVGLSYVIQQSTNLISWSSVRTLTNTSGTVSFQDPGIANQSHRFYRAVFEQ